MGAHEQAAGARREINVGLDADEPRRLARRGRVAADQPEGHLRLRASPGLPLAHQRPPCRARSAAPTAGRRGRPARWSTRRPRRGRAAAGWSSGGAGRWPWWASWAAAGGLPRGHYAGGCGCAPACLPSRAGCEHRARAVPGAPGHPRVSEASCVGCSMCGARAGSDGGDLARSRDLPAGDRARSHGVGTTHVFRVRRMPSVKDKLSLIHI